MGLDTRNFKSYHRLQKEINENTLEEKPMDPNTIPTTFLNGMIYGFGFWIAAVLIVLMFRAVGITAF